VARREGPTNTLPKSEAEGPRAEYARRLAVLERRRAALERRHRSWGYCKLGLALLALLVVGAAFWSKAVSMLWVAVPLGALVVAAILHERVIKALEICSRAVAFYERGLARLENRWMGTGEPGERFLDAKHAYARDLDLFGKGSLFELLCTARTRAGEETLAEWLLAPASPEQIRARQEAIGELRPRLDLREDLAVLAEDARESAPAGALAAWGEAAPLLASQPLRFVAALLMALWFLSLAAWAVWGWAGAAFLSSAINLSVTIVYRRRVAKVVSAVEGAAQQLNLLSQVFARLEREPFASARLLELEAALASQGRPPSKWIRNLNKLLIRLDSRRNMIVAAIDPFVLWTFQAACAVEEWRKRTGPALRRWLAAVGEFEALSALASHAYEHPADVYPEFVEQAPWFEAEGLAHPLLPDDSAVRNDLRLGGDLQVIIISGPNMAGKSTLVRAVGTNAVLAQCGAPVRARRLRLSRLAVGASICVLDSLQGGVSRFYAEITRLKQIVDLTSGSLPVLFLLDEFLQGTNSHDRSLGAEAMVRTLVERRAIGLLTTHDLALARIADALDSRVANTHFEDRLEDGKLVFDYHLRPGIVQTSNALNLMRSIGLQV
jgi:hypothetical protein